jgi:hypothetical protein
MKIYFSLQKDPYSNLFLICNNDALIEGIISFFEYENSR